MSSTLDRLRRLNSLRPVRDPARGPAGAAGSLDYPSLDPHEQGQEVETAAGPCVLLVHAYPVTYRRGERPLAAALDQPLDSIARIYPDFKLTYAEGLRNAVFLDTETTGLGAGAGVYAFMVGLGTFETVARDAADEADAGHPAAHGQGAAMVDAPTHFVVRQLFMRNPAEELALLHQLVAELAGKRPVVTFNGRAFDLPLLRTRVRYNRPFLPDAVLQEPLLDQSAPHLDLLLPARRLWRRRLQSCRLAHLEQAVLHHQRSEADVPGYLIPQLYADYVRTGDPRDMERVFYHNREDIVSMVGLATHLTRAFVRDRERAHEPELQGKDWLSLALTFEQMEDWAQAEPAYRRALDAAENRTDRAEVFLRLGRLQKRQGRWEEAAETWQLWLTSVPGNDPEPYVELAKYYEWQLQDYEQAEMWTAWALHTLRQVESEFAWARTIQELEHRLDRIRRKQGG